MVWNERMHSGPWGMAAGWIVIKCEEKTMQISGGVSADHMVKKQPATKASGQGDAQALNERRRAEAQQTGQAQRESQQNLNAEASHASGSTKGTHIDTHA